MSLFLGGSLYYQPKQSTIVRAIPQNGYFNDPCIFLGWNIRVESTHQKAQTPQNLRYPGFC